VFFYHPRHSIHERGHHTLPAASIYMRRGLSDDYDYNKHQLDIPSEEKHEA
jgi:hypothetical protein